MNGWIFVIYNIEDFYEHVLRNYKFSWNQTQMSNILLYGLKTKYSVARKRCKGNPLLHFHANMEHFYIVDSYIYANNTN
jgi:hypothetical protein